MMCKVQDVADFFIDSTINDPDDNMTNLRINKLLFFAQGWSLVKRKGTPLFKDDFYALDLGPVIPEIYRRLKVAGRGKIQSGDNDNYDEKFSEEETQLLIDVLRHYSKFSTDGLVDLTHKKGSPWDKVYEAHMNNIIPKEDIREYFERMPDLEHFSMPALKDSDYVGYRDEITGNYVLPEDWIDE